VLSLVAIFLAGRVGPAVKWWNASAFAGPFPATLAAQATAAQYFGAPEGVLPALPQAVVALHSPRIRFQLRVAAYAEFKQTWQVCVPRGLCTPAQSRQDALVQVDKLPL
jgi:hypothetical protein